MEAGSEIKGSPGQDGAFQYSDSPSLTCRAFDAFLRDEGESFFSLASNLTMNRCERPALLTRSVWVTPVSDSKILQGTLANSSAQLTVVSRVSLVTVRPVERSHILEFFEPLKDSLPDVQGYYHGAVLVVVLNQLGYHQL